MSELVPKVTNIAVPASGAGFVDIVLTMMCSKVEIMEDPSLNNGIPQGLTGFYTDTQPASRYPNVGTQQTWLANTAGQQGRAYQPIIFGGTDGRVHGGEGGYVGAQGTIVLRLQSLSPTATGILLAEWP